MVRFVIIGSNKTNILLPSQTTLQPELTALQGDRSTNRLPCPS